jgi:CubicO group peptidase (beta-lactamase class C family)
VTIETLHATAANWRTPPYHRWAFHHIDQVLRVAKIAHAPGEARPLPETPAAFDEFSVRAPTGATLDLDGFLDATVTDAIVILRDGAVVFERYAHGMTAETPHILMSSTKAMTGLMAGILERDGDLDLDAPVSRYVPEVADGGYAGATVRDLIDMRTGIVIEDRATYDAAVGGLSGADGAIPTFAGILPRLPAPKPHGGPFSYISANTDLAGWAMQRATGRPFADLVSERLWKPMGAEHPAAIIVDHDVLPWCAGGMVVTARDFARVGALLVDDGWADGAQIVPPAYIADLRDAGDLEAWRTGEWGQSFSFIGTEMSYRAGWYSVRAAPKLLFAMGVHGQNLFIDFEHRVVIAKLSSQDLGIDPRAIWLTHAAVPELVRCAAG